MSTVSIPAGAPPRDRVELAGVIGLLVFVGALQLSIAVAGIVLAFSIGCWALFATLHHESVGVPRFFWPLLVYAALTLLSAAASYDSAAELLKTFDANAAASRAAIQGLDESTLGDTFTLRRGETVVLALPRAAALRVLLMNHTIHHRGQLSAYFRLNGVTHPPIYGPNAEMSGR